MAVRVSCLRAKQDKERQELANTHRFELEELQRECGEQGHDFKYAQVAGEGRYCTICAYHTYKAD
jgi:hypothetical protein